MPYYLRQLVAIVLPSLLLMIVFKADAIPEGLDLEQPFVGPVQQSTIDTILLQEDVRFTTCRNKSGQTVCGHYSLKNWPLQYAGAAFAIEHCIIETEDMPLVSRLNEFCDGIWNQYSNKAAFKQTYPACWPIWRSAKRVKDGTQMDHFKQYGCVAPIPAPREGKSGE